MSERKSGAKWAAELGIEITDPIGWKSTGTSMCGPISKARFVTLANMSKMKGIEYLILSEEPETVTVEVLHKSENLPQSGYKRELDISTPEGALFMKNPKLVSLRFEYEDGSWGIYRRVK